MPSHYTHGPDYIKDQEKKKKKKKKGGLAAKLKARRDATNKAIKGM
jgi:hypothetical protein